MTRVAFLWHMHQPYYEDLVTREHILPWVRLHAIKDYYGMVALLREFPHVQMTFNLVPSLLVQLESFAANRANDRYLELGLKPADALTPEDVRFILQNFFHAHRQRMIAPYPRYAQLLELRGSAAQPADIAAAARRFSVSDLRDLQVWQKLAWFDPYYLEKDPRVLGLVEKGRLYTEADKAVLRSAELDLLNAVIPAYRALAEARQIEISTSPFYHPILPLLCDTEIYRRTHPESDMPRQRFLRPGDATEQLERAIACHERLFGSRPAGLWPSEGSVSDAVVQIAAQAGFRWMATDELILARTLGVAFARDPNGHSEAAGQLYTPYRVLADGAEIACGFRDHLLSDRIGFVYSGWEPEQAAEDFVSRLVEGGRNAKRAGILDPTIFVILDGENAWEHFEGGGRPFLRALYQRLSVHSELRAVTMSEACQSPRETLTRIFPGSWIDANFYIWIGHQDDRRGWDQLADARRALDDPGDVDAATLARAREEVLIAEGSDWFWWYGDDHSSEHDQDFDDLFRRHLRNVYRLLQKPVPEELFLSNITVGTQGPRYTVPVRLLTPTIDGQDSSYFEWLGAGLLNLRDLPGAMHRSTRETHGLTTVRFAFDRISLHVRLEGESPLRDLLADGRSYSLVFPQPVPLRLVVGMGPDGLNSTLWGKRPHDTNWTVRPTGCRAAVARVLEMSIPLADIAPALPVSLSFVVAVADAAGHEITRQPASHTIDVQLPDAFFEARQWSA